MLELRVGYERRMDLSYASFVLGRCAKCGRKAQKRSETDNWWHVGRYDYYSIHSLGRDCHLPGARFIRVKVEPTEETADVHFTDDDVYLDDQPWY